MNPLNDGLIKVRDWIGAWARRWGPNLDHAEDLAQDVLILTLSCHFCGESKLSFWVYRITWNHFLTMRRRSNLRACPELRHVLPHDELALFTMVPLDGLPSAEAGARLDLKLSGSRTRLEDRGGRHDVSWKRRYQVLFRSPHGSFAADVALTGRAVAGRIPG